MIKTLQSMKTSLLILFLLISAAGFSQKGVTAEGNSVTMKEIAPVWPGCEGNETEKKKCFNQQLAGHISENFDFSNGYTEADKGTKIILSFFIDKKGKPEIINVSGGSKALQKEAKRVIMALPEMKPGSVGGKPAKIKYTVPFNF